MNLNIYGISIIKREKDKQIVAKTIQYCYKLWVKLNYYYVCLKETKADENKWNVIYFSAADIFQDTLSIFFNEHMEYHGIFMLSKARSALNIGDPFFSCLDHGFWYFVYIFLGKGKVFLITLTILVHAQRLYKKCKGIICVSGSGQSDFYSFDQEKLTLFLSYLLPTQKKNQITACEIQKCISENKVYVTIKEEVSK